MLLYKDRLKTFARGLLIERLIAQGHEIANHGTQDIRTSQLAAGAFASQFREANDIWLFENCYANN